MRRCGRSSICIPLVRSRRELERVLKDVEAAPGIVLYTLFNRELAEELEKSCKRLNVPCVPALKPILQVFESYLGTPSTPTVGGQHVLDADYFRRIEALNFTMLHDDGHLPANLNDADIILLGISRTSKTPTSIYLANRGFKTANVPLVPACRCRRSSKRRRSAFVVGLVASAERISQVRQNRVIEQRIAISRTMSTARRLPPRSPRRGAVRAPRLADHRRDPPLDRGDRGGDHPPLSRPGSAGARSMSSFLQAGSAAADPGLGQQVARADARSGRACLHRRAARAR